MTERILTEEEVKNLFDANEPYWSDKSLSKVWYGLMKLKPCPFCGCEIDIAIRNYKLIKSHRYLLVHPDNGCILEGYESRETSARGELVDKWNWRVNE